MTERMTTRTVLFVCPHGAGKSRMAAAFFETAAPPGWYAITAGLEPAPAVSPVAVRLVAGTPAERHLDHGCPRTVDEAGAPDLVVTIDCSVHAEPTDASRSRAETRRWDLRAQEAGDAMREELRRLAEALAASLAPSPNEGEPNGE